MVDKKEKKSCCGCSACKAVCPVDAIAMKADKKGFLYPFIDYEKCIKCNLCESICPTSIERKANPYNQVYALKNKNEEIRNQSSSGGLFSVLAINAIEKGGVVYGAVFDENWKVVHARIDNEEEIQRLRGSKYVQSDLKVVFREVKEDLLTGKEVLFSGSPCQVAGLLSFLKKKYDNLITLDFVCHGVPNPRIWKEYLDEVLAAFRAATGKSTVSSSLNAMSTIKDIRFRDKSESWEKFRFVLELAKASAEGKQCSVLSSVSEFHRDNDYMRLFLDDYINRPSCFECKFREGRSGANYTIGDFWGIQNHHSNFYDENGISLLMSRQSLPSCIKKECDYIPTTFEEAKSGNRAIYCDWTQNPYSKLFYFLHDKLHIKIGSSLRVIDTIKEQQKKILSTFRGVKRKMLQFT